MLVLFKFTLISWILCGILYSVTFKVDLSFIGKFGTFGIIGTIGIFWIFGMFGTDNFAEWLDMGFILSIKFELRGIKRLLRLSFVDTLWKKSRRLSNIDFEVFFV